MKSETTTDKTTTIGISGASCSGKSWLAQHIASLQPDKVTLFDLDSYYRPQDFVAELEFRHDNPESINLDDAATDLALLKNGQTVRMPVYDFDTHQQVGEKVCQPNRVIVVEGIFVFANPALRELLDVKVWVSAQEDIKLDRRIMRDTHERGRTQDDIINQYNRDVSPGYQKYIYPLRQKADVIYENNGQDADEVPRIVELLLAYAAR